MRFSTPFHAHYMRFSTPFNVRYMKFSTPLMLIIWDFLLLFMLIMWYFLLHFMLIIWDFLLPFMLIIWDCLPYFRLVLFSYKTCSLKNYIMSFCDWWKRKRKIYGRTVHTLTMKSSFDRLFCPAFIILALISSSCFEMTCCHK